MSIPSGWYFCAESNEIAPGGVMRKEVFGTVIVLWRTRQGVLHVTDAACPHLGSDLGVLGRVEGEHLHCFSHGHRFDGEGTGVTMGCEKHALRTWPVHEISGLALVWYDAAHLEPTWQIPEALFDAPGRGRFHRSDFEFATTVETINEDNFDVGHLFNWHELSAVDSTLPEVDGHTISVVHDFRRHSLVFQKKLPKPLDILSRELRSRYSSTLYGPGFTWSQIDLPDAGFAVEDAIFPTPLAEGRVQYTTFVRRIHAKPSNNPIKRALTEALHAALLPIFVLRLRQEHRHEGHGFWENQTRIDNPRLSDKEWRMIGPYRDWCQQFHPKASAPTLREVAP